MNSLKLSKRVIGIALSVLFVNAALADATSDARIQAYKSNKLNCDKGNCKRISQNRFGNPMHVVDSEFAKILF